MPTPAFRPRPAARPLGLALLLLALAGARDASAQARPREATVDSFTYRVATFEPNSGPPGTEVQVKWVYLPAITPVQIGVGAIRVGFEVVEQVMTDRQGEFVQTVRIPEWAEPVRPHNFLILDLYFRQLAVSKGFHVTDEDGFLSRRGRLGERAGKCRLLVADDIEYALEGDLGDFAQGDLVEVRAKIGASSSCGSGVPLAVTSIRAG